MTVVLTIVLVSLTLASSAWAAEYKAIYKFKGGGDGQNSTADLVLDAAGNLYGTTVYGGANDAGTVFKLTPNPDGSWTETVLYSFGGEMDAAYPWAGLIFDGTGNLYGTTLWGGANDAGTVFQLTPSPDGSWAEKVLFSFKRGGDGYYPLGDLVFDAAGNLYGTTEGYDTEYGTVFKLTPNPDGSWTETMLHSFGSGTDGADPFAGVVFDAAGNLYGTTLNGGTYGYGTIFQLTPNPDGSWAESVLYNFKGGTDGGLPLGDLIFDAAGTIYGMTHGGGAYDAGTVFKLTPNPDGSWKKSKLHTFRGTDGRYPRAGLIFDTAGNLYGSTREGGAYDSGMVFKMKPQPDGRWKLNRLHLFKNNHRPFAELVKDAAGSLYGTTYYGGKGYGVVFKITP
jgi:uncharacterized repeat protein (TIGR03803 family)